MIDERTEGPAEHLGLLLEAANNTTFVGSLSAGVDGEVSEFTLPGGITYSFSTTDVRHGNSGKLQRVGLQEIVLDQLSHDPVGRSRRMPVQRILHILKC